jgi:ABC-type nitrate/sulfonate/bicarbonate transport system substrate-binding protein
MKRLFGLAAACVLIPLSASAQELRFGYPATPAGAIGIVGNALDIWKKHKLDLSAVQTAAGIDTRNAMVAGSVNIGINGMSNFLTAAARGAPLVSIGVAVNQCAATTVAVRAESPYRSLADLKGKRIGSEVGTITHSTLVDRVLPGAGVAPGDFKVVNVRFRDMISALLSDSVEAVTAVEPFLSAAEHAKSVRVLTDFCPYGKVYMLLVANQHVRASGEPVQNFLRAIAEIHGIFKNDPAKAAQIYGDDLRAKGFDIPPDVVQRIIARLGIAADTAEFKPDVIDYAREEVRLMKQNGFLDGDPDVAAAFDVTLNRQALAGR